MFPLPEMIIAVLTQFAGCFLHPSGSRPGVVAWRHPLPRPRTVAAILRVMGLGQDPDLNAIIGIESGPLVGVAGGEDLVGLLIRLLPPQWVPLVVVDDTVERRRGKRIKAKGCYRDAVRSSQKHVVKCFGLKWVCMMLLVRLPWSSCPWALPFLTVLAPSKQANQEAKKRHKTTVDWTCQMVKTVSRWLRRPGCCWGMEALPACTCLDLCPARCGLDQPVAVGCPII